MTDSSDRRSLTPAGIVELASAFYGSATLFAALELDVFQALAAEPGRTAVELADAMKVDRGGLRLLLDACAAVGLAEKDDAGRYRNAPAAAISLVRGAPADLTRAIAYNRDVYAAWGRAAERVRTGRPVEAPSEHLGGDPGRTRRFVMAMHGRAMGIGRAVVPMLDLSGCRRTYAALLAAANPGLACTVMDLPPVAAIACELIAQAGVADRVVVLPGDYHTAEFPGGNDAVTLFGVLHQEEPDAIRSLLRRAREALRPGGRVFVLDVMTDPSRTRPAFAALFALNMSLTTEHGWVFAESELFAWLEEAGFRDCRGRPAPPPMPHRLVEARRP